MMLANFAPDFGRETLHALPARLDVDEPEEMPDDVEVPWSDEAYWDVFIPDDDELDPLPELGDFWNGDPEELRAGAARCDG